MTPKPELTLQAQSNRFNAGLFVLMINIHISFPFNNLIIFQIYIEAAI